MRKVEDLVKSFENLMLKSRNLNDDEFDKFLCNLELVKKNIMMLRRRNKSKLIECENFRDFLKNENIL